MLRPSAGNLGTLSKRQQNGCYGKSRGLAGVAETQRAASPREAEEGAPHGEEQLRILKQGIGEWYAWRTIRADADHAASARREAWEETRIDLSNADLSGANVSGANLVRANLREANLSRVRFIGADLRWADLSGANLSSANLSRVRSQRGQLGQLH
jgi:hypothetical protein